MAVLSWKRWVFSLGAVLLSAGAAGGCGDSDNPLEELPPAGKGGQGGSSGDGATGGTVSAGTGGSSGGTGGSAGRSGGTSTVGGETGVSGEGGAAGGPIDPPESCTMDAECAPAGMVCDPLLEECVDCFFDTDCAEARVCREATCVSVTACETSLDCASSAGEGVCDVNNGRCVECLSANDCPSDNDCTNSACVPYTSCSNSLDCSFPQVCDTGVGRCFECARHADCGNTDRCIDHTCRTACQSDNTCTPDGELCNLNGGYCVSCLGNDDCPSVYHCDTGECVRDTCAAGSMKCEGNAVATCRAAGDGYDLATCGTRQTCVAAGLDTACHDWVCTAGTTECDAPARTLIQCSEDGLTANVEEDCQEQGFICYQERCQDLECVPSAYYCEGETVRICSADGLSSSLSQNCVGGEFCSDEVGACVPELCVPNEPWCNGTRAQVCNERGSGSTGAGTDCRASDGLECAAGECRCVATRDDCDGDLSNGCEANTSTDPDACGGCDNECSNSHIATRSCASSVCNGSCTAGYQDCNADKLSDGCETHVATDPDHCNGCDITCSAQNVPARRCTNGTCDGACAAGYGDCNQNKQTDGCETPTASNPDACGGCTNVCSSSGMAARACSDGTCTGTCATGYMDCNSNKLTDGCEADTRSDEAHCGNCETVCGEGESCVNGECGTCNNTVLFLADGITAANNAIQQALETAGLQVTRVNSAISTYTGTPAPTSFGAILLPVGNDITVAPASGFESTIATANAAGIGVVFTGWAAYRIYYNYFSSSLNPAMIASYSNYTTSAGTYTLTVANHPIWNGVPTSFSPPSQYHEMVAPIQGVGTTIATCSGCGTSGAAVIVRDPTGGQGRVVHFAHSANYSSNAWYVDTTNNTDSNLMKLFANAAKWAARCL